MSYFIISSNLNGLFGRFSQKRLRGVAKRFRAYTVCNCVFPRRRVLKTVLNLLLFLIIFFSAGFAYAQSAEHSFHDLENLVVEHDYSVAANLLRLQAVAYKHSATRSQLWPEFSSFYRYYQDGLAIIDENDLLSASHLFNFRLSQDLIKMTKIRSGKLKQIEAEKNIAQIQLEDSKEEALLNFRKEYIDILADSARSQAYQKLIDLSQELLEHKKARYENQEELYTEVLKVEAELITLKGMLNYHQNHLKSRKKFLAEYFNLDETDIPWNEIRLKHATLSEKILSQAALKNNSKINLSEARGRLEATKISTAIYENFSLSPYFGYRFRGDRFSEFKAGPELGVRFSLPLGFINIRKQNSNRFRANQNAWKLAAEGNALELKREMNSLLNEYQLLSAHLKNTNKLLQHINERIRIERARIEKAPQNIKLDPAKLPGLAAEKIKLKLQQKIYGYEQDKIYYEIIHLAGISEPENFPQQPGSANADNTKRALWVWHPADILATPESENDFVSFCKMRNINQVFLSLHKELIPKLQSAPDIGNFITFLHQQDVRVSALFGEPLWALEQNRSNLLEKIAVVLEYNSKNDSGKFDAIHLDIEPHTLPEWRKNREALLNNLAETLMAVKELAGSQIGLEIDLPAFYHKVDEKVLKKIIETADTVTIMAYERKSVEKVMAGVNFIVEQATQMNKNFMIGFNAKEFGNENSLQNLIDNVGEKFNSTNGFKGFAIHDYRTYRNLVEK